MLRQAEAGLAEYRNVPGKRDRYESRLKFKRDLQTLLHTTDVAVAYARGRLYGEINGIQRVRNMPETSLEELAKLSQEDLQRLNGQLLQ